MKVINLIGSPSAGKSTTAAGLFFEMKLLGLNCELVDEYAKSMCWREMPLKAFQDQIYITAKQNHRLYRIKDKVDYAITDSPLLLGSVYSGADYYGHYEPLLLEMFNSYDNVVYLIDRVKPYNPIGRNQDAEQAEKIHELVVELLNHHKIPYTKIDGDKNAPQKILNDLNLF